MNADLQRLDVLYATLGEVKGRFDVLSTDPALSDADRLARLRVLLDDAESVTAEMVQVVSRLRMTYEHLTRPALSLRYEDE